MTGRTAGGGLDRDQIVSELLKLRSVHLSGRSILETGGTLGSVVENFLFDGCRGAFAGAARHRPDLNVRLEFRRVHVRIALQETDRKRSRGSPIIYDWFTDEELQVLLQLCRHNGYGPGAVRRGSAPPRPGT